MSKTHPARAFGGREFAYVDINAVDRTTKAIARASRLSGAEAPSRARQVLAAGDVLVSTVRPNLNAVARVGDDLDGAIGSTGFSVLRPTERLDGGYLFHWVRSPSFVAELIRQATGASYPAVSDRIVREVKLPLPPIDEQRRIARILGAADRLLALRRRSIAAAAGLAASLYRDMFGRDPGAVASSLGDLCDVASGITKGRRLNGHVVREVPYLAVSNVQDGRLDLAHVKTIEASDAEVARFRLMAGDLLLTEGGDPDKLGRGTLWSDELDLCIHQNHVFRVRIRDDRTLHPVFLCAQVASAASRLYFLRAAKQTTGIASINRSQLCGLPLRVPPIDLQRAFADRQRAATRVVRAHERHQARIEALVASIQQRAFAGAL